MVDAYDEIFSDLPDMFVDSGIYQRGLLSRSSIDEGAVLIEYTGLCIQAAYVTAFDAVRDFYATYLDTEVIVPSESAIISTGDVGNDARFENHSYEPN